VYPGSHTHSALEPPDCEFAPQLEHAKLDVAPITAEKVFAEQLVHKAVPETVLYLPGTHREHGPPFAPVAPALQIHDVTTELPATALELSGQLRQTSEEFAPTTPEYVPAPQLVQAAVPFTALYFPVAHNAHVPPFGPVAPTLHTHAPRTALDAGALEYSGQLRHVPAPVAPTVPEYVFTPQSTQLSFPVVFLYLPATHRVHTLPFPLAPALHRHSTRGTSASAFATHDRQTVAPTPAMYVPAAQDVQFVSAIRPLNLPASQIAQVPFSVTE
jgi:hypothetical protein